jgi:hypothetical protein
LVGSEKNWAISQRQINIVVTAAPYLAGKKPALIWEDYQAMSTIHI